MKKLIVISLFLFVTFQLNTSLARSNQIRITTLDCNNIADVVQMGKALVSIGQIARIRSKSELGQVLASRTMVVGKQLLFKVEEFLTHNNCSKS